MDGSAYFGRSKLAVLLGPTIWAEIAGKKVIDFGCGKGSEAIEMAKHGATKVIGLDIQPKLPDLARSRAKEAGISETCVFCIKNNRTSRRNNHD